MEEPNPQLQEYLGKMDRPIPGQSLTEDPETPQSYTSAPEFTVVKEALEYIFVTMTDEEATYENIMSSISRGVSIMELTQLVLFAGFNEGKWNPDLMLLLVEPTAYMIMGLAEKAGLDYEITDDDDEGDLFGAKMPEETKQALESKEIPEETMAQIESTPSLMERPPAQEASPSLMQRQ